MVGAAPSPRQRLDKWLWYARIVKSRTLAQKLIQSGVVRVDSERVTAPDHRVGPGMVLTMTVHERLRVLKIVGAGERRGPASEAQALYEDLSPSVPRHDPLAVIAPAARAPGAGRPTKKERRQTDRFRAAADPDGEG